MLEYHANQKKQLIQKYFYKLHYLTITFFKINQKNFSLLESMQKNKKS